MLTILSSKTVFLLTIELVLGSIRQSERHRFDSNPHQLWRIDRIPLDSLRQNRSVVGPGALCLGVAQTEHACRCLPEAESVVDGGIGGQVFAVWRKCHGQDGARMSVDHLHFAVAAL